MFFKIKIIGLKKVSDFPRIWILLFVWKFANKITFTENRHTYWVYFSHHLFLINNDREILQISEGDGGLEKRKKKIKEFIEFRQKNSLKSSTMVCIQEI